MYRPTIDHVEFKPAGRATGTFQGRVSFLLNGCVQFLKLPVHRTESNAFHIDFPATVLCPMPQRIQQAIEARIAEVLA